MKFCFSSQLFIILAFYLQMNQISIYPVSTAARVKGTPYFIKVVALTSYPSFLRIPMPAIFALAPIGVRFPPSVAPQSRP